MHRLIAARKLYVSVLKRHPLPEARRRKAQIDRICETLARRHESMQRAHRASNFRLALSFAMGIRKDCVGYRDVDTQIPILELETDYAAGEAFVAQGRHDSALRCFSRCSKRNPGFKKVRERIVTCRKLAKPARPHRIP